MDPTTTTAPPPPLPPSSSSILIDNNSNQLHQSSSSPQPSSTSSPLPTKSPLSHDNGNDHQQYQLQQQQSKQINYDNGRITTKTTLITLQSSSPSPSPSPSSSSLKLPFKTTLYRQIRSYIWLFPLSLVVLIPTVCITPYLLAVWHRHVEPVLPYVSDAGGVEPQAAYFSQLLDLIAIIIMITTFVRYKQMKYYLHYKVIQQCGGGGGGGHSSGGCHLSSNHEDVEAQQQQQKHPKQQQQPNPTNKTLSSSRPKIDEKNLSRLNLLNFITLLIGYISAFGIVIFGNFRVTEIPLGHFFGVAITFYGMMVYMCLMTYLNHRLASSYSIESAPITMAVVVIFAFIALIGCMLFSAISVVEAGWKMFFENTWRLRWTPSKPGYIAHVCGTFFEWFAINTVGPFYACLFWRMKHCTDWHKIEF